MVASGTNCARRFNCIAFKFVLMSGSSAPFGAMPEKEQKPERIKFATVAALKPPPNESWKVRACGKF